MGQPACTFASGWSSGVGAEMSMPPLGGVAWRAPPRPLVYANIPKKRPLRTFLTFKVTTGIRPKNDR